MIDVFSKSSLTLRNLKPSDGYERLVEAHDEETGLHALISVHSTKRGPAAGGCRMYDYANREQAIFDVERLSRGMSYKNAAADLPLGGGKSVIIGDPRRKKTPELMKAFGRFIEALEGTYYTAEDVGVSPQDMAHVAESTSFVAGLEGGKFASGDPSPVTARGVFLCIKQTLKHATGSTDLSGKVFALQGLGHVGMNLAQMVHEAGGKLIVCDINESHVQAAISSFNAKAVLPNEIQSQDADFFLPCAMGGALNSSTIPLLKVRYVVGAANNQLAEEACGHHLHEAGILYAPDYIVNGGGIVNVAMEILEINDPEYRESRVIGLAKTLKEVLECAKAENQPPHVVADRLIEDRLT